MRINRTIRRTNTSRRKKSWKRTKKGPKRGGTTCIWHSSREKRRASCDLPHTGTHKTQTRPDKTRPLLLPHSLPACCCWHSTWRRAWKAVVHQGRGGCDYHKEKEESQTNTIVTRASLTVFVSTHTYASWSANSHNTGARAHTHTIMHCAWTSIKLPSQTIFCVTCLLVHIFTVFN